METIYNTDYNEIYFSDTHKSGLKIIFFKKEDFKKNYAIIGTNFGSVDASFIACGEDTETVLPDGIAHFLEHKLFESEEHGNAFAEYAKTGANANAYTSFDKTAYLFSCTDNFKESLKILLSFVTKPYFTDENVQKEMGIIGQEISMYDDDPHWASLENGLSAAYSYNPIRNKIAGTAESISKITSDLLYKCYNNFYDLSQMVLCVAGNVEWKDILDAADFLPVKAKECSVKKIVPKEPEYVKQNRIETFLDVSMPMFNILVKDNISDLNGKEYAFNNAVMNIICDILFSKSSLLFKTLYDKGLVNDSFYSEYFLSRNFGVSIIGGESDDPDLVYNECQKYIKNKKLITEEEFLISRNKLYGKMMRVFNDVDDIANYSLDCAFYGIDIFDLLNAYKNISCDDVNKVLNNFFDENKTVLSIVKKKEN